MYDMIAIESFLARAYPGRKLLVLPYAYNTTFLTLAQNTTQTANISIQANADFVFLGVRHRAQIGAAQTVNTKTAPFVRLLITDTGSNERFTDQAVDLENYSINGGWNRPQQYPRIIAGRSALQLVVTNYAPTAETYTSLDVYLDGLLVRAYE